MRINLGRTSQHRHASLAALVLIVAALPCALFGQTANTSAADTDGAKTNSVESGATAETIIKRWPGIARITAEAMIEKYGEPQRVWKLSLVWFNNGPWEKTVVYGDASPEQAKKGFYLEQSIGYKVPDDKIQALTDFDKGISVDKAQGELSARSDTESMNYLALRMADDIITGKRTVADARDFYAKTRELSMAGKTSPYLGGLLFIFPKGEGVNPGNFGAPAHK